MRKVRQGLKTFFANEINPLIAKFRPQPGEWETWDAFEGAYEESLDRKSVV
jgi:hypothetical protein